eukprot:3335444-Pleurochrysis_carterae.AAC.1
MRRRVKSGRRARGRRLRRRRRRTRRTECEPTSGGRAAIASGAARTRHRTRGVQQAWWACMHCARVHGACSHALFERMRLHADEACTRVHETARAPACTPAHAWVRAQACSH